MGYYLCLLNIYRLGVMMVIIGRCYGDSGDTYKGYKLEGISVRLDVI
jgi:hypothetical protein